MRLRSSPLTWFAILSLIAIGLALGLPPSPHTVSQLHTTPAALRLAVALLLIPYVTIWYASFYAFARLQEYTKPLKNTKDGAAFHKITIGMGILAFSLVVPTIISLILNYIAAHHPSFKPAAVIIINYLGLYPGMIAFLMLFNGARLLIRSVSEKIKNFDIRWHSPWFLLLAVGFSHLTIENMYKYHPYHLHNIWLLIITFIIPYLYGWMVGLLGAYYLHVYAQSVSGLLYRKAVKQFAKGIAVVTMASIAIQFVNITIAQRINHSLRMVLLVDYILLAIIIIGLALMALGTKKLKSIEDI